MSKRLSDELILDLARHIVQTGETWEQAAGIFGIHKSTVNRRLNKQGAHAVLDGTACCLFMQPGNQAVILRATLMWMDRVGDKKGRRQEALARLKQLGAWRLPLLAIDLPGV